MLASRFKLAITPRAQVAILAVNLRYWPELVEVLEGFSVVVIETQKAPLRLRSLRRIVQLWRSKDTRIGFAAAAAELEASGAKVLLAVDQSYETIHQLGNLMPKTPQVLVTHGSIRNENIQRAGIMYRDQRLLVVWGKQDVQAYSEVFEVPVQCIPVGSLRNASYLKSRQALPNADSKRPLLFVSQFAGLRESDDPANPSRVRTLNLIKQHLARYCREQSLPLRIALRPAVSGELGPNQHVDEMNQYHQIFEGVEIFFSDPNVRYSTYWESDCADVAVGVPAGSLTETFARGNKVLMIGQDPSTGDYLGFPREGLYLLHEPNYNVFAERLDVIRKMSTRSFADQFESDREYVVANAASGQTTQISSELIREQVNRM